MFNYRYNSVVLPFFFFIELLILFSIYLLTNFLLSLNSFNSFNSFVILGLWSLLSIYFKSYRVLRVDSSYRALKPTLFTYFIFSIVYIFFVSIGLLLTKTYIFHIIFLFILFTILILNAQLRYIFFHEYRLKGKNYRNAILLGDLSKHHIEHIENKILHFGFKFVEKVSLINFSLEELENIVKSQKIDLIFLWGFENQITSTISSFCDRYGIRLKLILPLSSETGNRAGLNNIGGFPVVDIRHEPLLYLGNRFAKRTLDIVLSSISVILVLAWLPIVVKIMQILTYPGPLFFIQNRIGMDGKIFKLYKFRTMHISDNQKEAIQGKSLITETKDPRVSKFGALLRRTNLDEYPQFINVLFGSMSTVGPRPYMVGEDKILEDKVDRYCVRRFVKPGITGWAAVNGYRGGTNDISLMIDRTKLDIWYLENWNIWLDLKIIFVTFWQMATFNIPKAY